MRLDIANYDAEFTQLQEQLANIRWKRNSMESIFSQLVTVTAFSTRLHNRSR